MKNKKANILGSILFSIFLPIWTFVIALSCIIIHFINRKNIHKLTNIWGTATIKIMKYLTGIKVEYENIPSDLNGEIIASEHQSSLEILALIAITPKPIFVLKNTLMKIPVLATALKYLHMIPVDRKLFNSNWMEVAKKELASGRNLIIFPEGTRVNFGKELPYRVGVFKLAIYLNKPIIPVAINSGMFWARRSWIKKPGITKIVFGKPFKIDSIEDGMQKLRKEYKKLLPR